MGFFNGLRELPLRGNVRELRNILTRAYLRGKGHFRYRSSTSTRRMSRRAVLSRRIQDGRLPTIAMIAKAYQLDDVQFAHTTQVFKQCHGNNRCTAAILGISLPENVAQLEAGLSTDAGEGRLDSIEGPKGQAAS